MSKEKEGFFFKASFAPLSMAMVSFDNSFPSRNMLYVFKISFSVLEGNFFHTAYEKPLISLLETVFLRSLGELLSQTVSKQHEIR